MFFAFYENTQFGRKMKAIQKEHPEMDLDDIEDQLHNEGLYKKTWFQGMRDVILAAFDLYFVRVIYEEFRKGMYKPNQTHRSLQLCEALFERYSWCIFIFLFIFMHRELYKMR